jgi:hypothetical protein
MGESASRTSCGIMRSVKGDWDVTREPRWTQSLIRSCCTEGRGHTFKQLILSGRIPLSTQRLNPYRPPPGACPREESEAAAMVWPARAAAVSGSKARRREVSCILVDKLLAKYLLAIWWVVIGF